MVPVRRLRQVAGGVLVAVGGVSLYAAWVLTRRTVFEYVHLGFWGVLTGVVLVGFLLTVTFGGVVALSRGYHRFVAREERDGDDAHAEVANRLLTPPMSRLWKPLVALGVVLWTVLFIAPEAAESVSAFEPLAVFAWILVPVSVHLDAVSHGTEDSEARTRTRAYVVGSLFPFFAALVGAAYLVRTLFVH
jgi:hypothetical protein